ELRNLTTLARKCAKSGFGARIFIKDEACNPSGSFKARRAAISVYEAKNVTLPGSCRPPAETTGPPWHPRRL
ncbi:MAG: PLP-dependent lyase/thiolase, partial [Treponema sp.]|nr:PLP-dependent lyase/thiolase [Treponema sp.]